MCVCFCGGIFVVEASNASACSVESINLFYEFIVINHSGADFIYGFSPERNINSIRQLNGSIFTFLYRWPHACCSEEQLNCWKRMRENGDQGDCRRESVTHLEFEGEKPTEKRKYPNKRGCNRNGRCAPNLLAIFCFHGVASIATCSKNNTRRVMKIKCVGPRGHITWKIRFLFTFFHLLFTTIGPYIREKRAFIDF